MSKRNGVYELNDSYIQQLLSNGKIKTNMGSERMTTFQISSECNHLTCLIIFSINVEYWLYLLILEKLLFCV